MTIAEVQKARAVVTQIRDYFVARAAAQPNAPAAVRDAVLDVVATLRAVERRMDAAIVELQRATGGAV